MSLLRRLFTTLPKHSKLGMPALSPTMQSGTIGPWKVEEGDFIKPGAVLVR